MAGRPQDDEDEKEKVADEDDGRHRKALGRVSDWRLCWLG